MKAIGGSTLLLLVAASAISLAAVLSPAAVSAGPSAKSIVLVLDASGSMNAKLPDGTPKIDAARAALDKLLASIPAETAIAFRAYGHGSPREKHDCKDTELLVPFGPAGESKGTIAAKAKDLKAQGYTPITHVLQTSASSDFPGGAGGEKTIVLVSDGKETCEGDPCAAIRALEKSGVQVVVHIVGFGVDDAARTELSCIAKATGGRYFDAAGADDLARMLGEAVQATPMPTPTPTPQVIVIEEAKPGRLAIKNPDLAGHDVTNAETGEKVGEISRTQATITVPAGIYNVSFGPSVWKGIEVKGGETTEISPGVLRIGKASIQGHDILETETGRKVGSVSPSKSQTALLPGTYDVTFGKAVWPAVIVKSGEVTELAPGSVTVKGAGIPGHEIRTADGVVVGDVSATGSWMPLPPGEYTIEIGGKQHPFSLTAGQEVIFEKR